MTGFRGLHSDAAMPPPDADLASREEGDPLPCPQDKEFFGLPVPVPVQKDARSMTQAEALHGGFLLDLMIGVPSPGIISRRPPGSPPWFWPQNEYIYKFIRKIYILKFYRKIFI